jgi:hypothetical protein
MVQHLVFAPLQSVSVMQVVRPCDGFSQTFGAPVWSETSSQPCPAEVLHGSSLVQKRGQLVAGAQTLPLPKLQQAWPLDVSQSLSVLHVWSQVAAQMPVPLPVLPPLLLVPPPTTPPSLPPLEEEQPPNHASSAPRSTMVKKTV